MECWQKDKRRMRSDKNVGERMWLFLGSKRSGTQVQVQRNSPGTLRHCLPRAAPEQSDVAAPDSR